MDSFNFWVGLVVNGVLKEKLWKVSASRVVVDAEIQVTGPLLFKTFVQFLIERASKNIPNILELNDQQLAGLLNSIMRERQHPEWVNRAIVMIEKGPDHPRYVSYVPH